MIKITEHMIDKAANALRDIQMKGRITIPWDAVPKSQKKKWLQTAKVVLEAAND
jgi:hypothetical protein